MRANEFISEISDERLQDYLSRAGRKVDSRMTRMAQARDRLNKGYEIYHADTPNKVVDRFEARTPAEAQRYYNNFISKYESDVDYDLRLRRATGIVETTDVEAIQLEELRLMLKDSPALFENTENYINLQNFLKQHGQHKAVIGKMFAPVSILSMPLAKSISYFSLPHACKLVDIKNNQLFFDCNGEIKKFPEGDNSTEDLLKSTLLFLTDKEKDNFELLLEMRFGDWTIRKNKQVREIHDEEVNENFADGRKPGRKGLSRRVGLPKKATLGQLEKIAKSSTGEKRRMAQWQLNMRRGKKNK